VILTPTHLGIVMEYAAGAQRRCARALRRNDGAEAQRSGSGGEIFDRICAKGRFSEEEARYFFKQLIAGVAYCHAQSVAHRDLKVRGPACFALLQPRSAQAFYLLRSWRTRCWTGRTRRSSRSATLGARACAEDD